MTEPEPTPVEEPDDWMPDDLFEECVQKEIEYRQLRELNTKKSFLAGDARRLGEHLRAIQEILERVPDLAVQMLKGGTIQLSVVEDEARQASNEARNQMDRLDRAIDEATKDFSFSAYQRVKKEGRKRRANKPKE